MQVAIQQKTSKALFRVNARIKCPVLILPLAIEADAQTECFVLSLGDLIIKNDEQFVAQALKGKFIKIFRLKNDHLLDVFTMESPLRQQYEAHRDFPRSAAVVAHPALS